jgi:hypothetical protein
MSVEFKNNSRRKNFPVLKYVLRDLKNFLRKNQSPKGRGKNFKVLRYGLMGWGKVLKVKCKA